jgi:hypothetical protein
MRKILGYFFLIAPFLIVIGYFFSINWIATLIALGIILATIFCTCVAFWLLE